MRRLCRVGLGLFVSLALALWPLAPANAYLILTSGTVQTCAAATTALALLPSPLSTATSNKYKTAICALAAAGYWSHMSVFYILATDNTPDAAIDLTGNIVAGLNVNGAETFFPGAGYQGDGATGYLGSGWSPATNGGANFTINSASYGVGISNSRTTPNTGAALGTGNSSAVFDQIFPIFTGGSSVGDISSSGASVSGVTANANGVWIMTRTGASAQALYQNGVLNASNTTAAVSLSTFQLLLGARYSNTAGPVIGNWSTDTIAFAFAANGLSSSDAAAISNIMAPFIPATMPTLVAAWGFNSTPFNYAPAGNINDVDTGNTLGATGFNWYIKPFWGNTLPQPLGTDFTYNSGPGTFQILASTNSALYRARIFTRGNTSSVFNGQTATSVLTVNSVATGTVLVGQLVDGAGVPGCSVQPTGCPTITSQISGTTGGAGTYQLSATVGTIAAENMNGYSSVGQVPLLKPGGYYEFCFSFNPANAPASGYVGDYITAEFFGIETLWGQSFTNSALNSPFDTDEIDALEALPSGAGGAPTYALTNHDENVPSAGTSWSYTGNSNNTVTAAGLGSPTFTNKQCYEVLWVTTAKNGGVGLVQRFFNNKHINGLDVSYTAAGLAQPSGSWGAGTRANFAGNMYAGDSSKGIVLSLDGGVSDTSNAIQIYSVTVQQ